VECHFVTGRAALLLKVYCIDNDHLMETILNTIQRIPYVQSTDTMLSLDQAFERQVWVKNFKSTTFRNL
jgi:Lrp/AsnC family transcriptional regulator for asnA, asnC and gidA